MKRCTTLCVGGAAISLALAVSTMFATKTTCNCKGGATFYLAHFCAAAAMLGTPFSCCNSCRAAEVRAEPVGTMLLAESTSLSSCIAPYCRAGLLVPSMRTAKPSCSRVAAAAFSGALHFG